MIILNFLVLFTDFFHLVHMITDGDNGLSIKVYFTTSLKVLDNLTLQRIKKIEYSPKILDFKLAKIQKIDFVFTPKVIRPPIDLKT